ncbi:MAG: SMP-30/gluconolactonase/LRE family protein [Deltaproteobacteria bacterium]|nr:SMP-30/gluconolactonase/LRE family protein [Deltaproteobacteria bacterium]MBW2396593.1 SMP-30/gluconolactonase/LRE family protein [Deltaproteobacteria bacterium]
MGRNVLLGCGLLVLLVGAWFGKLLVDAGQFRSLEPHFEGSCRLVAGAVGPEDLTIHPEKRVAYVSAADRRAAMAGHPVPGAIFAYALDDPEAGLVNLTPDAGVDFQPHGISLWLGPDGREVLFVVNHPPDGHGGRRHQILVFDLEEERLVRRPLAFEDDELLVMPNDIVGVGPDRFYLTNTHANPPGPGQTTETYLRLARARVVYFDGERFHAAIEGLQFPNGINASADGRRIYVAGTTGQGLRVYEREPASGALHFLREIATGSGLDNVEVAADGALWIGAHPKMLAVSAHGKDPSLLSPSQVLRVDPESGEVREVYLDLGKAISASSVAAVNGDRLLIGQIFGDGILDCSMAPARSGVPGA